MNYTTRELEEDREIIADAVRELGQYRPNGMAKIMPKTEKKINRAYELLADAIKVLDLKKGWPHCSENTLIRAAMKRKGMG